MARGLCCWRWVWSSRFTAFDPFGGGDSRLLGGWRKRWFYVSRSKVFYSASRDDRPRGLIDFAEIELVLCNGERFSVVTPTRTWELKCKSAEEAERWKTELEQMVKRHNRNTKVATQPLRIAVPIWPSHRCCAFATFNAFSAFLIL